MAKNGATLVLLPTHDWANEASLHYTHVAYRAIENRIAIVKSDYGWDSAFVDAYGRSHAFVNTTTFGSRAVHVVDLPFESTGITVAAAFNDVLGWLFAIACICFVLEDLWLCSAISSTPVEVGDD